MFLHYAAEGIDLDPTMDDTELTEALEDLDNVPTTGRSGPYWKIIRATLLEHSSSDDIDEAIKEWRFTKMWTNRSSCELCGHTPIKYHFQIINRLNGNSLVVGSECIWNYLDIPGAPDKDVLKKRLNALRSKARAIAEGKAQEGDIERLQDLQQMERDTNLMISKISGSEGDINVTELLNLLREPLYLGQSLGLKSTSFKEIGESVSALERLRRQLEAISKRSTKYRQPYKLLPAVVVIMGFRSGITDQVNQLENLRKLIATAFNVSDARGLIQMAWGEVKNGRGDVINTVNAKLERAKSDCQNYYSSVLDFVKPYDHLYFLVQAGIDSNKAQMDRLAVDARKLIESDDFLDAVKGRSSVIPQFVSYLTTGDSRMEDAAYATVKFLQYLRNGYLPRLLWQALETLYGLSSIRDSVGVRKAVLRAANDGLINPEAGEDAVVAAADLLRKNDEKMTAIFSEEVDDIKARVKATKGQKVYEAMTEQWGFDVREFYQNVPWDHPYFPGFCEGMLSQFLRGTQSPSPKQDASIQKNLLKYKTKIPNSCWDKLQSKLTQPYTPSYGR
jgi:hypothetical protein